MMSATLERRFYGQQATVTLTGVERYWIMADCCATCGDELIVNLRATALLGLQNTLHVGRHGLLLTTLISFPLHAQISMETLISAPACMQRSILRFHILQCLLFSPGTRPLLMSGLYYHGVTKYVRPCMVIKKMSDGMKRVDRRLNGNKTEL